MMRADPISPDDGARYGDNCLRIFLCVWICSFPPSPTYTNELHQDGLIAPASPLSSPFDDVSVVPLNRSNEIKRLRKWKGSGNSYVRVKLNPIRQGKEKQRDKYSRETLFARKATLCRSEKWRHSEAWDLYRQSHDT